MLEILETRMRALHLHKNKGFSINYVFSEKNTRRTFQKIENFIFTSFSVILLIKRKAFSSVGRAAALQAAGHRFESGRAYK